MEKIKTIYTVHNGKVISAEIVKETPKLYWIERTEGFGYCTNFVKEYVCITPQEAVLEEYNRAISKVNMLEEVLKKAQDRFANALLLRKEHNT